MCPESAVTDAPSVQGLLHALQVQLLDLERQNEKLRASLAELKRANGFYYEIFDRAPVGYCTLTKNGQIHHVNRAASELLGVARGTLRGQFIRRYVFEEDLGLYFDQHEQLQDGATPKASLLRMVKSDGATVWVHWASSVSSDADAPDFWRVALSDAGALHKATQAQQRLAQALDAQVHNLSAITGELAHSEERERLTLASNLHDNLAQWLAAVKISLASLNAPECAESISKINVLVDRADASLRNIICELSPPSLVALGLNAAWKELIAILHSYYGLEVQLHDECEPCLLDDVRRAVLYRCVRELLINVAKHSGVRKAELSCSVQQGHMTVAVSDDGCGFDAIATVAAAHDPRHFGLIGLSRRLAAMQGSMDIDTAPGKGCLVVLSLPVGASA